MTEVTVDLQQERLSTEGADPLLLAGANDGNLLELARISGCRVVLRGDQLLLSGDEGSLRPAAAAAARMIDLARAGRSFGADDVDRFLEEARTGKAPPEGDDEGPRIILPGARRAIVSRTGGQREYLDAIEENDIVVAIGPAGTGKTYLAVAAAVESLFRKRVRRIVLARPAVEAGENLGFLPGDLQEKVDPYLRPLYDALDDMVPADRLRRALEGRAIEVAPLAYMRGRTLQDAFVILDEAQNATALQMKMFLTRLGVNSRAVITGDKTQIDLPRREDSGLLQVERILPGVEGIAFVYLQPSDVVRHRLVRDIIRAYETHSAEEEER